MDTKSLKSAAKTIRALSIDGIQKANSGHPGLPMGCAELGAVLYGEIMKHNPEKSDWADRDRFVLSAGHGSMFLYSLLYLSGYGLTIDDLKQFRQLGSKTPGHPEFGLTKGVETTTGPLGAGFGNAVGMAIAEQMLAAKFNTEDQKIIDHFTYVLSGDGCLMEGVSSEAASLAGHLGLGKLIVFYDSNKITIEGSTELAFTEDVLARFKAYGWQTLSGDAYDMEKITAMVEEGKAEKNKPTLILLNSIIGKGSPNMAGTHDVHGAPLGNDEIILTRKNIGIPEDQDFYVAPEAVEYFKNRQTSWKSEYSAWKDEFSKWSSNNPGLKKEWDLYFSVDGAQYDSLALPEYKIGDSAATRAAGGKILNAAAASVPNLVGGSADLAPSNKTAMPAFGDFTKENRGGRTLHFGVREHAMGVIVNGIAAHGGLRPFCSTFLVFCDYMRPALRLAALMKLPVIYVFTHDSIFVGEDGPTHQPVEHITSLRIIPNFVILRPGDAEETAEAWRMALKRTDGPTALALTRQNLKVYPKADKNWKETITKGAYIVKDCDGDPDTVIIATGSEVELALKTAESHPEKKIRIVSVISRELFIKQPEAFRKEILSSAARTIVVEAGVSSGWERFTESDDDILSINSFGESGPASEVADYFGLNSEKLSAIINK